MAVTALLHPRYPERICWGCDKFCPADDLACGNGTIRTPHPQELFGDDWLLWCERSASASERHSTNDRRQSFERSLPAALEDRPTGRERFSSSARPP